MTAPAGPPEGYLGADALIRRGPAPELVDSGYRLETDDAPLLHRGLTLADLAHLVALHEAGVVPPDATATLARTLLELLDTDVDAFPYDPVYGDAYNSRERVLERRLGRTAGWLHTGRTRREAGRIAFRLALREELLGLGDAVTRFIDAVATRSREHAETLFNDTTYLQPAQPSTFGHYLLSFAEEAARHLARLEATYRWVDTSPAGVGGVGGTTIPVDRALLADLLGFAAVGAHARDAMWATDGLVDVVVSAAQAATTADRLAEDLEVLTTPQFGYVTLDASLCRASVQMAQKRNPYALAVIRGGASTLVGRVSGALVTQRTPSARTDNWLHAYGETAGAVDLARRLVTLAAAVVESLHVDVARLEASAGAHFSGATDLTDYLVRVGGLDYRTAYRIVGAAVAAAVEDGRARLSPGDLDASGLGADEIAAAMDPGRAVAARDAVGGSAPPRVRERAGELAARALRARRWTAGRRQHGHDSRTRLVERARALA